MKHLLITTIAAVVLVGCGESQPPKPPDISIHEAAGTGNIEAVKQHLAAGANVNSKDEEYGAIPLHHAAQAGHKEVVELLIAKGADVNAKTNSGSTPLHDASTLGRKEIAELLIAKGADVNTEDKDGWTPLLSVAMKGRKEIAELLIANGADVNAQLDDGPGKGMTPVDLAIKLKRTTTANLLRKHGAKTSEELKAEGK